MRRARPFRRVAAGVVGLLLVASGCHGNGGDDRAGALERADAKQLVGVWDVTFVLEQPLASRFDSLVTTQPVRGTMAFTENLRGEATVASFGVATHKGGYDLDLTPFGLPVGRDGRSQSVVARTAPVRPTLHGGASEDSVFIALDPGDRELAVRLTGILAADSIAGSWTAEYIRAEARGRFTMRRRASTP